VKNTSLLFVPPQDCSLSAFGVLLFLCVDTLPVCRPCRVFPSNGEKWKSERVSQHFSLIFYTTRGEIDIITTMSAITPSRLVERSHSVEREREKRSFPLVMMHFLTCLLKRCLSMRSCPSELDLICGWNIDFVLFHFTIHDGNY
jgi:hypothetical protein